MKQGFVPCKDDKPKYTEIILFQAGSDYSLSARVYIILHMQKSLPHDVTSLFFLVFSVKRNAFSGEEPFEAFSQVKMAVAGKVRIFR